MTYQGVRYPKKYDKALRAWLLETQVTGECPIDQGCRLLGIGLCRPYYSMVGPGGALPPCIERIHKHYTPKRRFWH